MTVEQTIEAVLMDNTVGNTGFQGGQFVKKERLYGSSSNVRVINYHKTNISQIFNKVVLYHWSDLIVSFY